MVENKLRTDLSEPKSDVIKARREKSSETRKRKKFKCTLAAGQDNLHALSQCPTVSAAFYFRVRIHCTQFNSQPRQRFHAALALGKLKAKLILIGPSYVIYCLHVRTWFRDHGRNVNLIGNGSQPLSLLDR